MLRTSIVRKIEHLRDPQLRDVLISFLEEVERIVGETITKSEFREFVRDTNENFNRVWQAIKELAEEQRKLAEAQRKTEERLNELAEAQRKTEERLNELAEAQRKTEERLDKLAEAQRKTEERLNELAEAQRKTEERLDKLAEAQRKTEERLDKLAEAQRKTEERLEKLIEEHRKTRRELGGLSHAFGYILEDRAIRSLPKLLKRDYGMEVVGKLGRRYIKIGREYIELNIFGKVRKDDKVFVLIGESKSRISKKAIDNFVRKCNKVADDAVKVVISYIFTPPIEEYAKQHGIILIPSYELEL